MSIAQCVCVHTLMDDDFQVDLEAADVVSFALPFVAMGVHALDQVEFESIPVPMMLKPALELINLFLFRR